MTIIAALTASSDPLRVKVNFSKLKSAPELVQMSLSITRISSGEGPRNGVPWDGSGVMIHQEALKNCPA